MDASENAEPDTLSARRQRPARRAPLDRQRAGNLPVSARPTVLVAERVDETTPARDARPGPTGTPGMLMDRVLVQTSAGNQLRAVVSHIDSATSGLVLSAGRISKRSKLFELIKALPDQGLDAPVVFDTESYRHHVATTAAPFYLAQQGLFAATLEENLSDQRALGVDVALAPTGLICADGIDALDAAAERADDLDRDDFMLTAPIDAAILDDPDLTTRLQAIFTELRTPVAVMLAGQLDPFDKRAKQRMTAVRALAAGPVHLAAFRTDYNGFDVVCHGGFTAAIGTGGSMRHAVAPGERARSINPDDSSPSVLYDRLASWWRGSKIAEAYGRMPAPTCPCSACDGRRIDRFRSREDTADAHAHGVATWQKITRQVMQQSSTAERAAFWKAFCEAAITEHDFLSQELRRTPPLRPRQQLAAWADLPA